MPTAEQLPLAEVKNRLSEVVERLQREDGRLVITKDGRPAAVVLSIDDLDSLEETLAVLSSPALMADIQAALPGMAADSVITTSREDALAMIVKS